MDYYCCVIELNLASQSGVFFPFGQCDSSWDFELTAGINKFELLWKLWSNTLCLNRLKTCLDSQFLAWLLDKSTILSKKNISAEGREANICDDLIIFFLHSDVVTVKASILRTRKSPSFFCCAVMHCVCKEKLTTSLSYFNIHFSQ